MNLDTFRIQFFASAPRYEWLELLGRGGMGVVFKARDLVLDEIVAIKILYGHVADDDGAVVARFKREISLNRKVKHPNVARMYDFGTSDGHPYITMEFVPGKDLQTLILEEGRIAPARALPILRQICLGTQSAHEQGIVHRDLKSQNIIVGEGDRGVDPRLRPRARPRGREADARCRRPRDAALHLSRTGHGTARRREKRHLLARDHRLRDARGSPPLHGRLGARDRHEADLGGGSGEPLPLPRRLPRAPRRRPPRSREEARGPVPERLRARGRLRARRGRRRPPRPRPPAAMRRAARSTRSSRISTRPPGRAARPPAPTSTRGPRWSSATRRPKPPSTPPPVDAAQAAPAPAPRGAVSRPVTVRPRRFRPRRSPGPSQPLRRRPLPPRPARPAAPRSSSSWRTGRTGSRWARRSPIPGCIAVEARSGEEVLDLLMSRLPDAVVMDVALPKADGFEVARILKATPIFAQGPGAPPRHARRPVPGALRPPGRGQRHPRQRRSPRGRSSNGPGGSSGRSGSTGTRSSRPGSRRPGPGRP